MLQLVFMLYNFKILYVGEAQNGFLKRVGGYYTSLVDAI